MKSRYHSKETCHAVLSREGDLVTFIQDLPVGRSIDCGVGSSVDYLSLFKRFMEGVEGAIAAADFLGDIANRHLELVYLVLFLSGVD